jgi:hypothetical protein
MRLPPLFSSVHQPVARARESTRDVPLASSREVSAEMETVLSRLARELSAGTLYPDGWSYRKRHRHLIRLKKQLQAVSAQNRRVAHCLRLTDKNIMIERLAAGGLLFREALRTILISSVGEAYWINRKMRQQVSDCTVNVWKRSDRLQLFRNAVVSMALELTDAQGEVLLGVVRLLEERSRGKWRDVREDVERCTQSVLVALACRPGANRSSAAASCGQRSSSSSASARSTFHFPRLEDATLQHPSGGSGNGSGNDLFQRYADMAFTDGGASSFSNDIVRRFNRKVILFIKGSIGLHDEQLIELSGFLHSLSPCIDLSGRLSSGDISRQVEKSLDLYPDVADHFRSSCRLSRDVVKRNFANLITSFNTHLSSCVAPGFAG